MSVEAGLEAGTPSNGSICVQARQDEPVALCRQAEAAFLWLRPYKPSRKYLQPKSRLNLPGSHKLDHLISTAVRCQACFEGTFEPAFGPQNTGLRAEDSGRRLSVGSGPLAGVITQPTGLNPQSQEIIPNEEASSRTARSAGTNRRRSRRFYLLARHSISSPSGGA